MKRLVLSALAFAFAVTPLLAQQIGGMYTVEGTNLDGSGYGGEAEIRLTSNTTCEIAWVTGGTTSVGICMKNQNAFAAGYVLGNSTGLVIYEIMPNGTLEGIWTISGQSGSGTERLIPQ